jgi:hypothetical protein
MPKGLGVLLRPASIAWSGGSVVQVLLPPESPARERLAPASVRRTLEEALGKLLGATVTLEIGAAAASEPAAPHTRITAESARKQRLERLIEEEPVLGQTVQEWDLELAE